MFALVPFTVWYANCECVIMSVHIHWGLSLLETCTKRTTALQSMCSCCIEAGTCHSWINKPDREWGFCFYLHLCSSTSHNSCTPLMFGTTVSQLTNHILRFFFPFCAISFFIPDSQLSYSTGVHVCNLHLYFGLLMYLHCSVKDMLTVSEIQDEFVQYK